MPKLIKATMLVIGLTLGVQVPLTAVESPGRTQVSESAAQALTASPERAFDDGEVNEPDEAFTIEAQIENVLFGIEEAILTAKASVSSAFTLDVNPSRATSNSRENIRFAGGAKFVSIK